MGKVGKILKLRNQLYVDFAEKINREHKKIIVYGAGMIGQIVIPDIIDRFMLHNQLVFFVDADISKQGKTIEVGNHFYQIKGINDLKKHCVMNEDTVLLITNSHFYSVVKELDSMKELENIEAYIVPVMQITELESTENASPVKLSDEPLIPKVIHYCWFSGKEMPDTFKKCIASWEKYCPDYEIKRWDESNYDINKNLYMRQAYENKKWGFVPDYARIDILYHYGGIYLDTDVELVKNLDVLRYQRAFCGVEKWGNINLGGCSGAVRHHPMIKKLLEERSNIRFVKADGTLNLETCGVYETRPFIREGMKVNNSIQQISDVTIYSSDYFHPYDYMSGQISMTENTFSIHHFNGGWLDDTEKEQRQKTLEQYRQILERMESAEREK